MFEEDTGLKELDGQFGLSLHMRRGKDLLDSHVILHLPQLPHDIYWIRFPGGLLYRGIL